MFQTVVYDRISLISGSGCYHHIEFFKYYRDSPFGLRHFPVWRGCSNLNDKHSYAWARQYDLGGINIAIDYTEYWSYYHASFFILTDYLGCYNGDYYFYKPTN